MLRAVAGNLGPGGYPWSAVPGFLAYLSADQANVTGNGTYATLIADTEVYDTAGGYDNTTGIFTAPVTGKYHFDYAILFEQATGATRLETRLVASNRTIWSNYWTPTNLLNAGFVSATGSVDVDMDAGDTARAQGYLTGIGADTADYSGSASIFTWFSGRLVA